MKKVVLLFAVVSLAVFVSCQKEEAPGPYEHPVQELVPSLDNGVVYSEDQSADALFTIGNEDNELLEDDALLLTNVPEDAVSYYWDFGNGRTSTQAQPSHKYKMHGYYNITLTVTDAEGNARTGSQEVLVLCIFGGGNHDR